MTFRELLGYGKAASASAPAKARATADRAGAAGDFPRGGPDGDKDRATADARWLSSIQAHDALGAWEEGRFLLGRDSAGRYAGWGDDRHILTVAGSRAGKGVSLIVPNLLFWPGSVIAIDPKGELATVTASRRSMEGSRWSLAMPGEGKVYALDPFKRVTGPAAQFGAAFNPLKGLDPESEYGVELAWQIADALVIQSKGEGAHWTQSARSFLRGLILYVAASEPSASRHLVRVRELLTEGKEEFDATLVKMKDRGGVIGHAASALSAKPDRERGSIVSTCEVHTDFLEGEPMKRVLAGSDFSMEDLKRKRMTVYLCLPATRLATHGRWLRLVVAMALEAMEKTGPIEKGRPPVLFCLDEFAALGHMESIEKAAGQVASFGVKLWPVIQDLTQLQRDYEKAWETFMGNAGLLTFFGNTDLTTAEHIAKRLGDTEVTRTALQASENWQKTGGGSGPDVLTAMIGQGRGSVSDSAARGGNRTLAQQIVRGPLLNPNEVIQAFARDARNILVMASSKKIPPVALWRCEYHDEKDDGLFGGLFDPAPGQDPPRTSAAMREERDRASGP